MKKIGFIGYGNMGRVVLNSFLESGALNPENIYIYNRTREKLNPLKNKYPSTTIKNRIEEVAENVDILFICTSTYVIRDVIEEVKDNSNLHIVLINAGVELTSIENVFKGKITRTIPTMTSEVLTGYTIINHNAVVSPNDREYLESLFQFIGEIVELDEDLFSAGSDLTSCAPAIIAELHNLYIKTISEKSGIPFDVSEKMFRATLQGTYALLEKTGESPQELINRVATKGGATESAISVLRKNLPEIFEKMLLATTESHNTRSEYTKKQFSLN